MLIRYIDPEGTVWDWENLEAVQVMGDEIKEQALKAYSLSIAGVQ